MAEVLSVLFVGLVVGSIYSLAATGLVLTFRISGVFNFAQGAIGMFFAYLFFQLSQGGSMNLVFGSYGQSWHLPVPIALILVVGILAPAFGWGLDAILFRKLREAGSVVRIVATIGVLIALEGLAAVVWGTTTKLDPKYIFPKHIFSVGGFVAPSQHILTIVLTVGLALGLVAFLKFSPLGVRMRAVVDRPDVSELMGVHSARVSGLAWGIGTGFAALAGILLAPSFGTLDPLTLTLLVIAATAAAVVGRLENIPLTLAGGAVIGIAQQLVQRYASANVADKLQPSIPFIVLFLILFLPIRWPAGREPPPPPPRTKPKQLSFQTRAIQVGLIALALIVLAMAATPDWQNLIAPVPAMALIFLSLVLLSGYAGQVSLSQAAFAGFGAFICAHLVVDHGWPFFLAAVVAGVTTVPLGALLASRAAQLPPLFLGFATLAFAAVMDQVAFSSESFSGGLSGIFIDRPGVTRSSLAYFVATLIIFGLFALAVNNIRKGKVGLALAAMRDSQTAVSSLGSSVVRLKFTAFCVSAFIAGFGGALFAGAVQIATPTSFLTFNSLLFLALAVIGGISRWTGALIGAVLFLLFAPTLDLPLVHNSYIAKHIFNGQLPDLLPVFFGLGAIGLAQNPHGVVEQIREGVAKFRERIDAIRTFGRGRAPEEEEAPVAASSTDRDGGPVSFPEGRLYHRPGCLLTVGKEGGAPVSAQGNSLRPCPVCEPEPARA